MIYSCPISMSRIKSTTKYRGNIDREPQRGFTVVELIIVVVVIAILAAISIVSYGSWRAKVARTEVTSDLHNVHAGMEDARNRLNTYPTYAAGTLFNGVNSTRSVFTPSEYVTMTYSSGSISTYCITAQSEKEPSVVRHINIATSEEPEDGSC